MKKSILISIRPQHVVNILNGKKTIELRKVLPKWVKEEVAKGNSVDFYVYVTKAKPFLMELDKNTYVTYDLTEKYRMKCDLNGLVPCKFTVRKIEKFSNHFNGNEYVFDEPLLNKSCVREEELENYLSGKNQDGHFKFGYALHIEDLVIFDEPMKLSDFYREEYAVMPNGVWPSFMPITKAPQSMQTVWVEKKV